MRPSEIDFIRQMGVVTDHPDHRLYAALMFQPRAIGGILALGIVLQSAWLFLALSAALWWSTVFPARSLFDAAYNHLVAHPRGLAPLAPSLAPRRFAQAMAGTAALTIGGALLMDATLTAWVFQGLFAIGVLSAVVARVCGPAKVYLAVTQSRDVGVKRGHSHPAGLSRLFQHVLPRGISARRSRDRAIRARPH